MSLIQTVKSWKMLESRRLLIYVSGQARARPALQRTERLVTSSMVGVRLRGVARRLLRDSPAELLDEVHVVLRVAASAELQVLQARGRLKIEVDRQLASGEGRRGVDGRVDPALAADQSAASAEQSEVSVDVALDAGEQLEAERLVETAALSALQTLVHHVRGAANRQLSPKRVSTGVAQTPEPETVIVDDGRNLVRVEDVRFAVAIVRHEVHRTGGAADVLDHLVRERVPEALLFVDARLNAGRVGRCRLLHVHRVLGVPAQNAGGDDRNTLRTVVGAVGDRVLVGGAGTVQERDGAEPVDDRGQTNANRVGNVAEAGGYRGAR